MQLDGFGKNGFGTSYTPQSIAIIMLEGICEKSKRCNSLRAEY
jgi:hypothetical protein